MGNGLITAAGDGDYYSKPDYQHVQPQQHQRQGSHALSTGTPLPLYATAGGGDRRSHGSRNSLGGPPYGRAQGQGQGQGRGQGQGQGQGQDLGQGQGQEQRYELGDWGRTELA